MHITLKNPLDMHLHLRDDLILQAVAPFSARSFVGGVIMPNLEPPITSLNAAIAYRQRIQAVLDSARGNASTSDDLRFVPFCALYITDTLTPKELESCAKEGFRLLKLYPKGATTNSDYGVAEVISPNMRRLFSAAQEFGMIVCIHGESAGFSLEREHQFGLVFEELARSYPHLKIIIEHMSDRRTIPLLESYENLYATLTLHHITMHLDNVVGGQLCCHHFCKPVLKTPQDTQALLELALQAHKKVSFGSDSAPHTLESKLNGAAGIFSAPCLLPQLAELFETYGALENLQAFVSDNAMRIYDVFAWCEEMRPYQHSPKEITLKKVDSFIPEAIYLAESKRNDTTLIPLKAGKKVSWQEI